MAEKLPIENSKERSLKSPRSITQPQVPDGVKFMAWQEPVVCLVELSPQVRRVRWIEDDSYNNFQR